MIGENRQLVTDEPVEVQDCRIILEEFCREYPNLIKGNRSVWTCKPVGLPNTGISTSYAQKSLWSLVLHLAYGP